MLQWDDQRVQRVHESARASWRGLQLADRRTRPAADQEVTIKRPQFERQIKQVLFVDPAVELQRRAQDVLQSIANVDVCSTFSEAHIRLVTRPPDLLVTGIRLHAHNGLHLVYVAAERAPATRCAVCVFDEDMSLAREVELAGAFLMRAPWFAVALKSLATSPLPRRDRRPVATVDRRQAPRGGRRSTDSWIGDGGPRSRSPSRLAGPWARPVRAHGLIFRRHS